LPRSVFSAFFSYRQVFLNQLETVAKISENGDRETRRISARELEMEGRALREIFLMSAHPLNKWHTDQRGWKVSILATEWREDFARG
jgi:hypothetical protein